MNYSEINSPGDLAGQVAALQRQVFTLLLALIVVSGTVAAYLGYESYHLGKDAKAINAQVVQPYKQKLPAIETFVSQVVAYGQAHPPPRLRSSRRQPRTAVRTKIRLRWNFFSAARAIRLGRLVAPVNDEIPNVRNPREGVGENKNRILLVD